MRTVRILSTRKGISTILGTLIFVGILFSSVVPMLLVMNQADTLYEQKKFEQEREDDRRDMEELQMYVYPISKHATQMNFTVYSIWL